MRRVTSYLQNFHLEKKIKMCPFKVLASPSMYLSSMTVKRLPNFQLLPECPTVKESVFAGLTLQQKRKYAPNTTIAQTINCWNCNLQVDHKKRMICELCGFLQDLNEDINYFDLLNVPNSFNVETKTLNQRFRKLQTLVHPDKFSNRTEREQLNSADWSSYINKAYKTLSMPIERGQYILKLHGLCLPDDNSALNKEFLLEMMERNEAVQEAETKEELQELNKQLTIEFNEKMQHLSKNFNAENLKAATATLIEMKYLLSIQNSIKKKLEKFI